VAHLSVSLALDFDAGSEGIAASVMGIAAVGIAEVVMAAVGTWELGRRKMSCHPIFRKKE
jgi:hypothetical protein